MWREQAVQKTPSAGFCVAAARATFYRAELVNFLHTLYFCTPLCPTDCWNSGRARVAGWRSHQFNSFRRTSTSTEETENGRMMVPASLFLDAFFLVIHFVLVGRKKTERSAYLCDVSCCEVDALGWGGLSRGSVRSKVITCSDLPFLFLWYTLGNVVDVLPKFLGNSMRVWREHAEFCDLGSAQNENANLFVIFLLEDKHFQYQLQGAVIIWRISLCFQSLHLISSSCQINHCLGTLQNNNAAVWSFPPTFPRTSFARHASWTFHVTEFLVENIFGFLNFCIHWNFQLFELWWQMLFDQIP